MHSKTWTRSLTVPQFHGQGGSYAIKYVWLRLQREMAKYIADNLLEMQDVIVRVRREVNEDFSRGLVYLHLHLDSELAPQRPVADVTPALTGDNGTGSITSVSPDL